jgi:hypothetical protein
MAAADTKAQPARFSALRVAVLLVAGVCAVFWFVTARASVADALPLAKGVRLGLWTTLVFLLAVWPALMLAICNVAVRRAAALAALAASIYLYMSLTYFPSLTGRGPLTFAELFPLLLLVLLITSWIYGDRAGEAKFAQAKLRLAVLCVAGLGTVLWLSSFVPIMRAGPGSSGFEAIPAFYGTILFLVIVLPLLVIGLRGTEQRNPTGVRLLLGTVLAASALFGLPQLFV